MVTVLVAADEVAGLFALDVCAPLDEGADDVEGAGAVEAVSELEQPHSTAVAASDVAITDAIRSRFIRHYSCGRTGGASPDRGQVGGHGSVITGVGDDPDVAVGTDQHEGAWGGLAPGTRAYLSAGVSRGRVVGRRAGGQ